MSPHALPLLHSESHYQHTTDAAVSINGHSEHGRKANRSLLRRCSDDKIHDLICVGFGPASLAIAVALHDALDAGEPKLRTSSPNVRFIERQPRFAWHAGMLLPGAKMQITFIKDLATLRNPRSEFTFLNYLHRKGRLLSFTNLSTFLPQRIEYEDYMRWCAGWFDDVVDYDRGVDSVVAGQTDPSGAVEYFEVTSRDSSGSIYTKRAKNVVIAVGGKPIIPECLPSNHPRILHSSQYVTCASNLFSLGEQPETVAVIGGGQSAAEVFHNISSRFPSAKSRLIIRGAALRPSDDSPFVNEIFDPEKVEDTYSQDSEIRAQAIALDRGTNYGVVRPELLEELYSAMYSQKVRYDDESQWPERILNHRTVTGAEDIEIHGRAKVRLHIRNDSGTFCAKKAPRHETLDVDLVVVASGYTRDAHEDMLRRLRHLMPGDVKADNRWTVGRGYDVQFKEGTVRPDAGVWLQGCNEGTHGLSDTLLSILATRGGDMVQSIFGSRPTAWTPGAGRSANGQ